MKEPLPVKERHLCFQSASLFLIFLIIGVNVLSLLGFVPMVSLDTERVMIISYRSNNVPQTPLVIPLHQFPHIYSLNKLTLGPNTSLKLLNILLIKSALAK